MKTKILTSKDYTTSDWSGGSTTQLFIFPPDASYAKRNFDFRLSSAQVKDETSIFTPLPGVKRFISSLTNEFLLTHKAVDGCTKQVAVKPLGVHCFDGGDVTECIGSGADFNLMLKNAEGKLLFCDSLEGDFEFVFVYCTQPTTAVLCNENQQKIIRLNKNELLAISEAKNFKLTLSRSCLVSVIL